MYSHQSSCNDYPFSQLPQEFQVQTYEDPSQGNSVPYYNVYPPSPGSAVSSDTSLTFPVTEFYHEGQLFQPQWQQPLAQDLVYGNPLPEIPQQFLPPSEPVATYPPEPQIQLHAPIPNQPCIRMLPAQSTERRISGTYSSSSRSASQNSSIAPPPHPPALPSLPVLVPPIDTQGSQDYYSTVPLVTFPTPSELLNNLAVHDGLAAAATTAPTTQPESCPPAPGSATSRSRRSRGRIVAQNIGFRPTDPDSISSHDKKRLYLESLEHYVMYLHDQLRIVGTEPVSLERVSTYRGLSSRSIRTLLVHMESEVRKMHGQTIADEQEFLDLRDEYLEFEASFLASQEHAGNTHH